MNRNNALEDNSARDCVFKQLLNLVKDTFASFPSGPEIMCRVIFDVRLFVVLSFLLPRIQKHIYIHVLTVA